MRIVFILLACISWLCCLNAQGNQTDSTQPGFIRNLYNASRAHDLAIYNGVQFYPYPASIEGISFLETSDWQRGSIIHEDISYNNILMKYDLVKDQVIVTPEETGGLFIALYSPRVKEFSFSGMNFVRLTKENNGSSLDEGFYQVLAKGKATAFMRKTKFIEEKVETSGVYRKFIQQTRYYILVDGKYKTIKNKKDLLNALQAHRNEIQQELSRNKLNFKRNTERAIATAVEFYNQAN